MLLQRFSKLMKRRFESKCVEDYDKAEGFFALSRRSLDRSPCLKRRKHHASLTRSHHTRHSDGCQPSRRRHHLPRLGARGVDRFSEVLTNDGNGFWAGFIPGVKEGDRYKFYVVGRGHSGFKRDPYAREEFIGPRWILLHAI